MTALPLISVIMANYGGAAFLPAAMESVLAQTEGDLELIVADDASPDDSANIVAAAAARDARVKLLVAPKNSGPGAARNAALGRARGEWVAIVDSDDILHRERFERLLAAAKDLRADAIADDLLYFSEAEHSAGTTLLGEYAALSPRQISTAEFIVSNTAGSGLPPLGYLKPMFRRARITSLRYDEAVRIGEDYDFLLRFLLEGGRFFLVPTPFYLYRRHAASVSHRLSEIHLEAMIKSHLALVKRGYTLSADLRTLLDRRLKALNEGLEYEQLVASLKQKDVAGAYRKLLARPALIRPLFRSLHEHFAKRAANGDRYRQPMLVFLTANAYASGPSLLPAAFPAATTIETIQVPPYAPAADIRDVDVGARELWSKLAQLGMSHELGLVAHGLAGLHAASFVAKPHDIALLMDKSDDPDRARRLADSLGARVLDDARGSSPVGNFSQNILQRERQMRRAGSGVL